MKTQLPKEIKTIQQAEKFLTELYNNGEIYHPEDDANDCLEGIATKEECDQLNKLMNDIYNFKGNENAQSMIFDPCEFILNLDPEYRKQNA